MKFSYYKVKIAYHGRSYFGWQRLNYEEQKPTVQGQIYQTVKKIAKYQECDVVGASRTDAGVHARGQIAKIKLPLQLEPKKLLRGLNSLLPDDIAIVDCEECASSFNPIKDAVVKEYHYYFSSQCQRNPIFVNNIFYPKSKLNLQWMREAACLFEGEHDFVNFSKRGPATQKTIREVSSCCIKSSVFEPLEEGSILYIRVRAKGFLRQMVRYMSSAIIKAGEDHRAIEKIKIALTDQSFGKLCPKAKACGLYLMNIDYDV